MEDKIFIAPRLIGSRFEDHSLPVNILEDFAALEDLIIEVAKGIFLRENPIRRRVPKGFSDGVYLKLVDIEEGSAVAKFAIANTNSQPSSIRFDDLSNFPYFEKAKDKIVSIVESVNNGEIPQEQDPKLLSYFNKIGKNLLDDESIDFGYDYSSKSSSSAILNKITRKKLLLSSERKTEYLDNIKLFALIPAIDQKNKTFQIETEFGKIRCPLTDHIRDTVFTALNEYENDTYVSIRGTAVFNLNDKIQDFIEVDSLDVLDSLDVSLRIHNLLKLEDNWYEGQGKALNEKQLRMFEFLFNSYFDSKLPLPAIFPTIEGNIQLEWKSGVKNIVLDVNLSSLSADFFYYNDIKDSDEKEVQIALLDKDGWDNLNMLIKSVLNAS